MKKHSRGGGIIIDTRNIKIGGGAYAAMKETEKQEEQKKAILQQKTPQEKKQEQAERRKYIEDIKAAIKRTHYWWMDLYVSYDEYHNLSEQEYLEIAKFAIDLYPDQMHRVRTDKLSANNYYEICTVMAQHGVFYDVNIEKLQQADVKESVLDICFAGIKALSQTLPDIKSKRFQNMLDVFKCFGKKYCTKSEDASITDIVADMKKLPEFIQYKKELEVIAWAESMKSAWNKVANTSRDSNNKADKGCLIR